jgi:hypothetical protein
METTEHPGHDHEAENDAYEDQDAEPSKTAEQIEDDDKSQAEG